MGNRVFYACQAVSVGGSYLEGVQSVGINYGRDAEPIYTTGRQQPIGLRGNRPQVEITVERLLPVGATPTYFVDPTGTYGECYALKTGNIGMSGWEGLKEYEVGLTYSDDISLSGSVSSISFLRCLLTEISYNFSIDGPSTESMTFVADNLQAGGGGSVPGYGGAGSAIRRHHFDADVCVFPTEVESAIKTVEDGVDVRLIQSISASMSISYSDIADNGKWPQDNSRKFVEAPIDVSCDITALARKLSQEVVAPKDDGYGLLVPTGAQADSPLLIKSDSIVIDFGTKNYCTGVSYSGGDAGGGNAEVTFTYTNQNNDFMPYLAAGTVTQKTSTNTF